MEKLSLDPFSSNVVTMDDYDNISEADFAGELTELSGMEKERASLKTYLPVRDF